MLTASSLELPENQLNISKSSKKKKKKSGIEKEKFENVVMNKYNNELAIVLKSYGRTKDSTQKL